MRTFSGAIIAQGEQLSIEEVIQSVFDNAPLQWKGQAIQRVHQLCLKCPTFDLDGVETCLEGIEPPPKDKRCTGQLMKIAKSNGWCKQIGVTNSKRKSRHYGFISQYQSML